jgi:hypothetical protein
MGEACGTLRRMREMSKPERQMPRGRRRRRWENSIKMNLTEIGSEYVG